MKPFKLLLIIISTQIYKTLSRNKHNKYSTLARFTNKSLRELVLLFLFFPFPFVYYLIQFIA